jgi:hypothetical protein
MALDVRWLRAGGGIVGHRHPPARRFNAGQKMIYGVVVLVGSTVAASGYILKFPCYLTDISQMQTPELVHAVASEQLHRNDRDGGHLRSHGQRRNRRELERAGTTADGLKSILPKGAYRSYLRRGIDLLLPNEGSRGVAGVCRGNRESGSMVATFWRSTFVSFLLAFAVMGGPVSAQTQEQSPGLKKDDGVPPATATNQPGQAEKKAPDGEGTAAALSNGMLTAPGAPRDVDTAPAKFSARTASDDQLPTVGYRLKRLGADKKASVYAELAKSGPATNSQVPATVGAEVPTNLALGGLRPVPNTVTAQFPELSGLTFATLNGKLVLIDATMRIVVDVAAP